MKRKPSHGFRFMLHLRVREEGLAVLLLAEDDPKIGRYLVKFLQQDGYSVDYAANGAEALDYVKMNVYELVILDWMMPERDGISVCRELRKKGYEGGILMLTARDTLENKVEGLEAGADDYLVKPFEYRELLARVKALSRRSRKTLAADILRIGPFAVERATMTVSKNGRLLPLSKKEYQIFQFLLDNHGRVIPRETLLDRIWGIDGEVTANNLDAHIRLLRKKVETKGEQKHIINVRGMGYKLEV